MKRIIVDSSAIVSVSYDAAKKALDLKYTSGKVYRYYKVPVEEYERFMEAPSLGTYLNKHFKPEGYKYRRIR